ncbi:dihydrolipoamide acetyltransferase family protein [Aeromicrobium sp. IC_218]|uniref:dihydrolipoamide acetyltransferase family protein n=1 Tax=Aeromicrobium sp. IC_218 TaxID=2545468 RepID=UPI001040D847|nr:dihydrolipoamide acetyltransferase family protein [Aeromicrobium sp. IC_218]TCI99393.1 2-oxo acid dehydrogenase subunit E2 [Aeromicrobium sp. IC_218]
MDVFNLPDVGEGLTEAEIVTWHVQPGDVVEVNQPIVDIETAKSVVELPSPFAGTVGALLVPEGETVPVGTPIVRFGDEAAAPEPEPEVVAAPVAESVEGEPVEEEPAPTADAEPAAPKREPVLVGYGPKVPGANVRRPRHVASVDTEKVAQKPSPKVLAKPPVRKLARDLDVDLASVPHDGEVVTRDDVEAFARPPVSAPAAGTATTVRGVRKATADAMVHSAFTAPHVTTWVDTDVTATVELVERLRRDRAYDGVRVTPLLLVAKAVTLALRRHPELNSSWRDTDGGAEIVRHEGVHLGIAAATDRGLLVPVVRDAERLDGPGLAGAIGEVVELARSGKAQPADLSGGTFSITNIGVFGIDGGTPILPPGQTGILATGRIAKRPWVVGADVVARHVMTLALTFDHRVVDGQQGAGLLADVAGLLHDPGAALTY